MKDKKSMSHKNRKKKVFIILLSILIIVIGIKVTNPIYGAVKPAIKLGEQGRINDGEYTCVKISYWDVEKDVMCFETFDDLKIVNDVYMLVCETEVKQKLWNEPKKEGDMWNMSTCKLTFSGPNSNHLEISYIGRKYFLWSPGYLNRGDGFEIVNEEVTEYIEQLSEKYDKSVVEKNYVNK